MATKSDTQNLSALVINRVASNAVFQDMIANDQVNPNELYLVEGDLVPSPYTSNPTMDGTASPGSSTAYAKGDHVHPTDTSRAPTSHATNATTYGTGTDTNYGHLKLSDSTSSTSSTNGGTAATPAAVKAAYDLANEKFTLPSQTGNSGKFLTTNGSSASWGTVSANSYSTTFTTNTWSSSKITVNASTHGCGTTPMVQVQVLNGTSYELYYGYPSTGWKVAIDSSGNITLSVQSGSEFAGRLIVK